MGVRTKLMLLLLTWHLSSAATNQFRQLEGIINRLPVLSPATTEEVDSIGKCTSLCVFSNCDSFAFSKVENSCKLYSHPTLDTPVPPLQVSAGNYTMYFKRDFCPRNWVKYGDSCYLFDNSADVTRLDAAGICEGKFDSQMVALESAVERDWVYSQLSSETSKKWWLRTMRYNPKQWSRTVQEFSDYVYRSGDSISFEKPYYYASKAQCAHICRTKHALECVQFVWFRSDNRCYVKTFSRQFGTVNAALERYDRIGPGVPKPIRNARDCSGNDLTWQGHYRWDNVNLKKLAFMGPSDCKIFCSETPQCVGATYRHSTGLCILKKKTCMTDDAPGSSYYNWYDNFHGNMDDECPRGIRFRDKCIWRDPVQAVNWMTAWNRCRNMGWQMWYPDSQEEFHFIYATYVNWAPYATGIYLNFRKVGATWAMFDGDQPNFRISTYNGPGSDIYAVLWDRLTSAGVKMHPWDPANTYEQYVNGNRWHTVLCQAPARHANPRNCKFTTPGREYEGYQASPPDKSAGGCMPWTSTLNAERVEYPHNRNPGYSRSWCRNPDSAITTGPWCKTRDGVVRDCGIPLCPEVDWQDGTNFDDATKPFAVLSATGSDWNWEVVTKGQKAYPICILKHKDFCKHQFGDKCYQIPKRAVNHAAAKAFCDAMPGWKLASYENIGEFHYIMALMLSVQRQFIGTSSNGLWLDMSLCSGCDSKVYTNWLRPDGSSTIEKMWTANEPSGDANPCIAHNYQTGGLNDLPCTYVDVFPLCEMKLG